MILFAIVLTKTTTKAILNFKLSKWLDCLLESSLNLLFSEILRSVTQIYRIIRAVSDFNRNWCIFDWIAAKLTNLCASDWNDLPVGREYDGEFLKNVISPSHALPSLKPPAPRWTRSVIFKFLVV